MTVHVLDSEAAFAGRTRRSMVVSVIVHAVLLAWIVLAPVKPVHTEPLTEIVLLEPGEAGAPLAGAMPAQAASPTVAADPPAPSGQEVRFARTPQRGTSMTTAISAVDLASSVLEQTAASKLGGRWTVYARLALRAAHVVLGLRGA